MPTHFKARSCAVAMLLIHALLTASLNRAAAQPHYTIDASKPGPQILSGHLKLGTATAPNGSTVSANSMYFLQNGKPWFPVMGEVHYSRVPRDRWESMILQMKAGGIDVIASYVFWIYHEEEEGKFDWSGSNDLRAFAQLCKKHDIYFLPRIGPWSHGEVRNGGFPDWIMKRGNIRKNDPAYLASTQRFYDEMAKQMKGLYFKDGGSIIGAQIENEYRFSTPDGLEHMLTLKQMALKAGIDVPFYTASAWPAADQKQNDIIPVWGGYPEAPWDKTITKLNLSRNYQFSTLRKDPAIGSDLLGPAEKEGSYTGYRYPYATAEMGGGNQITYHRRPIITSDDVTSMAYVKTGSGANLMGYYMFTGGSNPVGKLTTLQESKATKYPNDYGIINYDFQSPIGEWGELRPSYRAFKAFHLFLNDFGDRLVQYYPNFPDQMPSGPADQSRLRFAVRSNGSSGFIFINNYQRQGELPEFNDFQVQIKLKQGDLTFPQTPVTIKKGIQAVLPVNMELDGVLLNYATVQPLCRIEGATPLYVFFAHDNLRPEYSLPATAKVLLSPGAKSQMVAGSRLISGFAPGTNSLLKVTLPSGKSVNILTLTSTQALNGWKGTVNGKEHFFISDQELSFPEGKLRVESEGNPVLRFSAYPKLQATGAAKISGVTRADGILTSYVLKINPVQLRATMREVTNITPFQNTGIQLPPDERLPNLETLPSPGPQYQTNLTPVAGSRYYDIQLTGDVGKIADAYVVMNYIGDTGSAYIDGKLVADDFYSGLPMKIGFADVLKTKKAHRFLLQIVPLTDDRKIYFEDGIREPLTGTHAASLKSVVVVPKYGITL